MRGCAISSKRELCSLVERERREGLPVLSTKRGHGGYYLPADRTETEACVKRLRTEAASINAIADALEDVPDAALSSNDNATPYPKKDR